MAEVWKWDLTPEEIAKLATDFDCPRCGGEVEVEASGHERDSTYDVRYCPKCRWRLPEGLLVSQRFQRFQQNR